MRSTRSGADYRWLLAALSVLGMLYPLLDRNLFSGQIGLTIWTIGFWVALYVAMRALSVGLAVAVAGRVLFSLAIVVGILGIVWRFRGDLSEDWSVAQTILEDGLSLLLLGYVTVLVLRDVLGPGRMTANRIWGSVCVYVLIGLAWTFVYGLLAAVFDNCLIPVREFATEKDSLPGMDGLETRLYFSFVTLTTVGYGDLAPGNPATRLFATVEAVSGQLYLAVLVARMVGLSVSHAKPVEELSTD